MEDPHEELEELEEREGAVPVAAPPDPPGAEEDPSEEEEVAPPDADRNSSGVTERVTG